MKFHFSMKFQTGRQVQYHIYMFMCVYIYDAPWRPWRRACAGYRAVATRQPLSLPHRTHRVGRRMSCSIAGSRAAVSRRERRSGAIVGGAEEPRLPPEVAAASAPRAPPHAARRRRHGGALAAGAWRAGVRVRAAGRTLRAVRLPGARPPSMTSPPPRHRSPR